MILENSCRCTPHDSTADKCRQLLSSEECLKESAQGVNYNEATLWRCLIV